MASYHPVIPEHGNELKSLVNSWVKRYCSDENEQKVLIDAVITAAGFDDRLLSCQDVKMQLFHITHEICAERMRSHWRPQDGVTHP